MLQNDQFRIWLNAPLPVPGTTISSCYPDEFISNFLLQTGGASQAPISPLVCPNGYTTQGPFTSNYIACCPRSVSFLYTPTLADIVQWLGWICSRIRRTFRPSSFRRNLLHEHLQRTNPTHLLRSIRAQSVLNIHRNWHIRPSFRISLRGLCARRCSAGQHHKIQILSSNTHTNVEQR